MPKAPSLAGWSSAVEYDSHSAASALHAIKGKVSLGCAGYKSGKASGLLAMSETALAEGCWKSA